MIGELIQFYKVYGQDYVRIEGKDKTNIVVKPVTCETKKQYPRHWKRYCSGEGTPITGIDEKHVKQLEKDGVTTVEQLMSLQPCDMKAQGKRVVKELQRQFR